MKKSVFKVSMLFVFVLFCMLSMDNIIHAQCKMTNIGGGTISTKKALLGDGNSEALISILRKDSSYFMKIEYSRGFVKNMKITDSTSLTFVFNDMEIILYPVSEATSHMMDWTDFSPSGIAMQTYYVFIGAKTIVALYSITEDQLKTLGANIPNEIKLYYITEKNPRFSDKNGSYWNIMKFKWHYKKRLMKIIKCALE